jgi:tellurite methyltransferase
MRQGQDTLHQVYPLSAAEWLQQQLYTSSPLFDLRRKRDCNIAFATHFAGLSGDDSEGLLARQHELQPPGARKLAATICDSPTEATEAEIALVARGYLSIVKLCAADFHAYAPDLLSPLAREGSRSGPSRALWSPSPTLRALLPQIMNRTPLRSAIDVGCGSGRDAAFLAYHGWDVVAVDRDSLLVQKAVALGQREWTGLGEVDRQRRGRVTGVSRTLGANLASDEKWFQQSACSLLVVVRFLRRGVLELLPAAVAKGGWVIIEHFLTGCEKFGGPMKRSQMLERGELGRVFGKAGFEILCEEEVLLDDGRPVARFLAHRPAAY